MSLKLQLIDRRKLGLLIAMLVLLSSLYFWSEYRDLQTKFAATRSPEAISFRSHGFDLADHLKLQAWPIEGQRQPVYDLRFTDDLSRSQLLIGSHLAKDIESAKSVCNGETLLGPLVTCQYYNRDVNGPQGYLTVHEHRYTRQGQPSLYSIALVFDNNDAIWFKGRSSDCPALFGLVAGHYLLEGDGLCSRF